MASTPTSRKLYHVANYLMKRQIAILKSMSCGKDWDETKQEYLDLNGAALIVFKLRDDELGWRD